LVVGGWGVDILLGKQNKEIIKRKNRLGMIKT
jgi:hypothetical protein